MAEIVCPNCRVKVPLKESGEGPPQEIVECPGCGMLIDLRELVRHQDEQDVAAEWHDIKQRRRKELNTILVIALLAAVIAGIIIYVYCILNP
ncbi:MAG TPA: hypothetical protein VM163_06895 [bacterium]|nr:hypothetical protein [bacterium]